MPTSHYHIYSGGAIGIDEYAEQCAKEYGMQMHIIIPPQHSRSKFITPLRQQDLNEAEPHLKRARRKKWQTLVYSKYVFTPSSTTQFSHRQTCHHRVRFWLFPTHK